MTKVVALRVVSYATGAQLSHCLTAVVIVALGFYVYALGTLRQLVGRSYLSLLPHFLSLTLYGIWMAI